MFVRTPERYAFASLVVLTLSPVVAQGVWRTLAFVLESQADTYRLGWAAVLVASVLALANVVVRGWRSSIAGLVAVPLALLLADGASAIGAVTATLAVVAVFSALLFSWLLPRLPAELDGLATRRKGVAVLMLLFGLGAITLTTRLSAFMGDSSRAELSLLPEIPFFLHHSCLTAYIEGDRLATAGADNLYDMQRWPDLNGTERTASWEGPYAPFALDAFAYPPSFLLLPHVLLSWLGDFASQRAVWFTFSGLLVAAGLWTVAAWLGAGVRPLLIAPLIWFSAPTLGTLQAGNVHLVVMVAAMLALVAFETRRHALGGALLAFAILSKISPGLLLLVLLVRGRFREVAWTAGFGLAFVLAGILTFGLAPFIDFVSYELPRLSSGEALTFLADPESVQINLAPFGVPFKLAALGIRVDDPWMVARTFNTAFTVVLVVLTLLAARRPGGPRATAEVWAAVLTLSSLRSPLAPGYVMFALLWLLSLRAVDVRGGAQAFGLAAIWILLTVVPPFEGERAVAYSLFQQGVLLAVATFCLLRTSGPEAAEPRAAGSSRG
jgi:alpha-1,2-mannosyltransferase